MMVVVGPHRHAAFASFRLLLFLTICLCALSPRDYQVRLSYAGLCCEICIVFLRVKSHRHTYRALASTTSR
jgi:hypothetical protein